jgi:hypothetical protein
MHRLQRRGVPVPKRLLGVTIYNNVPPYTKQKQGQSTQAVDTTPVDQQTRAHDKNS